MNENRPRWVQLSILAHRLGPVVLPLLEMLFKHVLGVITDFGQHLGATHVMIHLFGRAFTADLPLIGVRRHVIKDLRIVICAGQLALGMRTKLMDDQFLIFFRHLPEFLRIADNLLVCHFLLPVLRSC